MDRRELLAQTAARSAAPAEMDGHTFRTNGRHAGPGPKISVVIPAHNEAGYLPRVLAALREEDYPGLEIVVVCNGCTDDTPEIAHGVCDRLVVLSQKNLGVARNLGARVAT